MAYRARRLLGGARGTQTLGEVFTANIPTRNLIPQAGEAYLDSFSLSFKGDGAVAVVPLETFLDLVNPFRFVAGVDRTLLRGRDAFALSNAFYGATPDFREGAIGEDDKVAGIRIPAWVALKGGEAYAFDVTRVAVTNISGEVIQLTGHFMGKSPGGGRLDIRQIPDTLPAVLGLSTRVEKLPKIGLLRGLLVFSTTIPTATADTAGIQRLIIRTAKEELAELAWADLWGAMSQRYDRPTAGVLADVLDRYGWADFSKDPIDLVGEDISLTVDAGVVSDPVRYIPVIEVAQ